MEIRLLGGDLESDLAPAQMLHQPKPLPSPQTIGPGFSS